jgi:hypothetical protein
MLRSACWTIYLSWTDSDFRTFDVEDSDYTTSDASWLHCYIIISDHKSCTTNHPVIQKIQQHVCYIDRFLLVSSRLLDFR